MLDQAARRAALAGDECEGQDGWGDPARTCFDLAEEGPSCRPEVQCADD